MPYANLPVAHCLPREGTILKRVASTNVDNWYLVELDQPIEYQIKVGEPYKYKLVEACHLLIRSRWADNAIGDIEPTSVFIVLVEHSQLPLALPLEIEQYYHVAWGMCHLLSNPPNPAFNTEPLKRPG